MTDQDIGYLNTLSPDEAYQFILRERPKQAAWKFLLDFQPGQKGLVLEGRAGSVSIELSKHYREIILIQDNADIVSNITHRAASLEVNNMTVICSASVLGIPFAQSTFDCVIIHDIGARLPGQGESSATLFPLLLEAKRVLKADGTLLVTGDNNSLFIRIRSELKRLKAFVMGNPVRQRRLGRKRPAKALCSPPAQGFHQVEGMIREAGFQHRNLFAITPCLIPFEEVTRIKKSGHMSRLKQWVSPAFAIIATQKTAPDSFLNRFSKAVFGPLGGEEMTRYISGNPDSVMLIYKTREGGAVIRLPLTSVSLARCQKNLDTLHALSKKQTVLSGRIPRVIDRGTFEGQPYFIESLIAGSVIRSDKTASLNRVVHEAASLLTRFHQETIERRMIDKKEFSRIASPFISGVLPYIQEDAQSAFRYIVDFVQDRLLGRELPLVFSHGDFQADNILVNPDNCSIQGLIDWDLAGDAALPLLDLLYLFLYTEEMTGQGDFKYIFLRQFCPLHLNNDVMASFEQYRTALGIASDQTLPLIIFFWLHHVAFRTERAGRQLNGWMNQFFYPILSKIYETVQREKDA